MASVTNSMLVIYFAIASGFVSYTEVHIILTKESVAELKHMDAFGPHSSARALGHLRKLLW